MLKKNNQAYHSYAEGRRTSIVNGPKSRGKNSRVSLNQHSSDDKSTVTSPKSVYKGRTEKRKELPSDALRKFTSPALAMNVY
jgi:hypothetical protein